MIRVRKYFLDNFRQKFTGKKRFQNLFNLTKNLSIQGLNFGNGGSLETSGEITLINYLAKKTAHKKPYIMFDVGANRGDYSIALLKAFEEKNHQIWCFEPSKDTFTILQKNLSEIPNVFLNNIGFGKENEDIPLYTNEPGSHIASIFPLERAYGSIGKLTEFEVVSIRKIDDFLIENNIAHIDFLKLDIEGNELNALLGASKALKEKKINAIQFEFGTCNIDSRTFFRDFWNLLSPEYNLFRLLKDGLEPITHYSEYNEIFSTINYFAELK